MKDVGLPEYGTLNMFINLNKIIKLCAEQDALWAEECERVIDAKPGQVQQFVGHIIKARTMLQKLNFSLTKCWAHATDIRGIYVAPMEQQKFPWANTCEELFIQWSDYERSHPFQETTRVDC
jgi:hypothetical protein